MAQARSPRPTKTCASPCPIEHGMRVLGSKWTGSLIWHLKDGPLRFNEIARALAGATRKMINMRLKELEARGLVLRTVVAQRPLAVNYRLTPLGESALTLLEQLKDWAEDALPEGEFPPKP